MHNKTTNLQDTNKIWRYCNQQHSKTIVKDGTSRVEFYLEIEKEKILRHDIVIFPAFSEKTISMKLEIPFVNKMQSTAQE